MALHYGKNSLFLPAAAAALAFWPILVWAQGSSSGSVTGTITDPSGSAVAGAQVTIRNSGTNAERTMQTNVSGIYVFTGLAPGNYDLSVSNAGFERAKI